jgi:hypothetical protein
MKKDGSENDKKIEPRREEFVVAPPEPPASEVAAAEPSLEARVEALEEGQVTPRTGA